MTEEELRRYEEAQDRLIALIRRVEDSSDRYLHELLDRPPPERPYRPRNGKSLVENLREIAEDFNARGLAGRVIDPPEEEAPSIAPGGVKQCTTS
jgi:hypothetical protein